jgi:SAM-dependent methyltransferase
MPDFGQRSRVPELMDTESIGFEDFRACLVDLAQVNLLTLAHRPTLAYLRRLTAEADGPLHIVDVGSGHGDMLRAVEAWAAREGIALHLTGLDINPWSARAAREAGGRTSRIDWVTADLFAWAPSRPIDVVISSLFTHHLDDLALVRFLGWMETTARRGWFVNDLLRHSLAYHGFSALARLARWHRFVRHDGPVSVSRAFTRGDWRAFLGEARIEGARLESWFPYRLCVARERL